MKLLFVLFFGLIPVMTCAVPEPSVYPNSGTTDARRFENTGISPSTSVPVQEMQEAQIDNNSRSKKSKDDFLKGPYDKDGVYRYVPEVRE